MTTIHHLPNRPDLSFQRRDAYSWKEVMDWINGKTAPISLQIAPGIGLAPADKCPSLEACLDRMSKGEKLLVLRRRNHVSSQDSLVDLPIETEVTEQDLKESNFRFLFYIKL